MTSASPAEVTVRPVLGIGEVRPGDDLATLIVTAAPWLLSGDVLVVTSKIVSKAEGQLVQVPREGPERDTAREAVLVGQTARVVARRGTTRIVQTHHGYVMASAGIDASNVDPDHLVLLPIDPDASARALRTALRLRYRLDVAVVVSDTMGRPWRTGLTDVALGAAGIDALRDYRGHTDTYGNELHITQMALVDELAAAAELVKGKYDQVPVAVIRGFGITGTADGVGARVLVRDAEHDLFSLGTAEARAAGLRAAAVPSNVEVFADLPIDPTVIGRALDLIGSPALWILDAGARDKVRDAHPELAHAELVAATAPAPTHRPTSPELPDHRPTSPAPTHRPTSPESPAPTHRPTSLESPDHRPTSPDLSHRPAPQASPDQTSPDLEAAARAGADLARLRAALLSDGLASRWLPADYASPADLPAGQVWLALLAIGTPG